MTDDYVVVSGAAQTMPNAGFAEMMTAVLARGASFRFQANGFSMSPFIRDGDVITIAPRPSRLRFGEEVVFTNPDNDRLTVHRIVHRGHESYLIRGDNLPEPDGTISHADILGRVICVERGGRRVRLGLGPERNLIAFLSRHGWLVPTMVLLRRNWLAYCRGLFRRSFHFLFKRLMP